MRKHVLIILLVGMIAGCATIPEDQCAKVNWYDLGVQDGREGYDEGRLARHREACAGVHISPDEIRYGEGRRVGLAEYCQIDNAVREGLAGHDYRGVCDEEFRRHHKIAYEVYSLKQDINRNFDEISSKESELRKKDITEKTRRDLYSEIRELDRRRERLRDKLFSAETELAHIQKK
jgi:hypothetical protein